MATCRLQHMVNVWNIEFLCSQINACRMLTDTPSVSLTWCEECYFINCISLNIEPISCELNWNRDLPSLWHVSKLFIPSYGKFVHFAGPLEYHATQIILLQMHKNITREPATLSYVFWLELDIFMFLNLFNMHMPLKMWHFFLCRLNRKIVDWKRWRKSTQSFIFG